MLLAWMPEKCFQECNPIFEKFEKDFKKQCTATRGTYVRAYTESQKAVKIFLRRELLMIFRISRSSLEKNGWLSKDFMMKPKEERPEGRL